MCKWPIGSFCDSTFAFAASGKPSQAPRLVLDAAKQAQLIKVQKASWCRMLRRKLCQQTTVAGNDSTCRRGELDYFLAMMLLEDNTGFRATYSMRQL